MQLDSWNISLTIAGTALPIIVPRQVHGGTIVSAASCIPHETKADGLWGSDAAIPFGVETADCMPLILLTNDIAIALHISRHTLLAGILGHASHILANQSIIGAYIGPHICENCFLFETKGESVAKFEEAYPDATKNGSTGTHLSLMRVVIPFLANHGVQDAAITQDTRCTYEDSTLPSYKRWLWGGKKGLLPRIVTTVQQV